MVYFRLPLTAFAALALVTGAIGAPALADNDRTPPGDPCGNGNGVGTGNPCNGNNGNQGANGNAGNGGFTFDPIEIPPEERTGVFITQIGATNRANATQTSSTSFTQVVQNGDQNAAEVTQSAPGTHYAKIAQDGDRNDMTASQDGPGQTVLLLGQDGNGNTAAISQTDNGSLYSAAAILQKGNDNNLILVQDGDDNQARLTQDGDDNLMTATQLDAGNRLEWTQNGSGLSDLEITQTGGAAMQITQTNNGNGGGGQ